MKKNRIQYLMACCARALLVSGLLTGYLTGTTTLTAQENNPALFAGITLYGPAPSDTSVVNKWLRTGNQLPETQADSAIRLYERALARSRQSGYTEGQAKAYNNLAHTFAGKLDYDRAIHYMQQSIVAFTHTGNRLQVLQQYASLTLFYESAAHFQSVIDLYHKVDSLYNNSSSARENELLAKIRNSGAYACIQSGNYDAASLLFHKTLSALPATGRDAYKSRAQAWNGLAILSSRVRNHEKALYYFNQIKKTGLENKDTFMVIAALTNEAGLYYEQGRYEDARATTRTAMSLSEKIQQYNTRQTNLYLLAITLIDEQMPKEAQPYSKELLDLAHKTNNPSDLTNANFIMGYNYNALKQYDLAKPYLSKALSLALKYNISGHFSNLYSSLSTAYEGTGQFKKALYYRQQYMTIRDSLQGKENAERITHIEMKYEVAEKDQQLMQQKLQLNRKESKIKEKNFWIGGIAAGTFLLLALSGVLYRSNRQRQRSQLLQLEQQQKIRLLQAKMGAEQEERSRIGKELHDGIASQLLAIRLNVSAMQGKDGKAINEHNLNNIARQLEEATSELRTTAHNLMPDILLRNGLVTALEHLCIQTSRNTRLEVDYQVYGTMPVLQDDAALSLYRIVQELIQNTLKHAQATQLLVQLSFRNSIFHITVEDNGQGFSAATDPESHTGIGLKNVRQRVKDLNGSLDITGKPGLETTVYMEFEEQYIVPL